MRSLLLTLVACSSTPTLVNHAAPPRPPAETPTTLAAAMAAGGLQPLELAAARLDTDATLPGVRVEGRFVTVVEERGYRASSSLFARRASDGAIVMVHAAPEHIVMHVAAGCQRFAGGRGWFETVRYTLPPGEHFAGSVDVRYIDRVEVLDYADREPDGSPCPPMAVD